MPATKKESFSVKERSGRYIAGVGDQKLEQSINLSSKNSDSLIGNVKQKQFIAQWDLIYHEMADIHRLDKEDTGFTDGEDEVFVHHQSLKKVTCCDETSIKKMLAVFEKYGNPMSCDDPTVLHNFVSKENMTEGIRCDLLNNSEIGEICYTTCHKKRLVETTCAVQAY